MDLFTLHHHYPTSHCTTTMRFVAGCLGCVLALAAQGTCDDRHSDRKAAIRSQWSFDGLAGWLGETSAQQRLDDAPAEPPVPEFTETIILETVITESHPRITEAPILRRKLGSNKWDLVHDAIQGRKRDATICPSDYQLCPQSMNGGCCPTDRACGTDSCYPTSTGPASACGTVGYKPCGINQGGKWTINVLLTALTKLGGCCPSDYICGTNGCIPSAGVPNTETCGPSSYLCPASLSYGCCRNGMACGLDNCYSTSIQTFTITQKFTTTSSGHVKTITSTSVERITPIKPSLPTEMASNTLFPTIPKFTSNPSAVEKVAATTSSSGGLTKPQLNGIIAGAVILLVIILAVAFIILVRLNKVKKAIEASSRSYRSYRTWSQSGRSHKKPVKARNMEKVRGEMMALSEDSKHIRHPSEPSPIHVVAHEMEASAPHSGFPFSPDAPLSPQYHKYTGGYAPVATSEPSSPPLGDYPMFSPYTSPSLDGSSTFTDLRDQNLRFGHLPTTPPPGAISRPAQHERQWSGDSNASKFTQGSSAISESDTGHDTSAAGSSSQRSFYGFKWIRGPKR